MSKSSPRCPSQVLPIGNNSDQVQKDTLPTDTKTDFSYQYRDMDLASLELLLASADVSKNQKKKIMKQIKWVESADARREHRKKRKIKHKIIKAQQTGEFVKRKKFERICTVKNFQELFHFAIDLSFDDLMTNKDLRKLGKQVGWCYKENRRSANPVQYHLCGIGERLKSFMDPTHINWDLHLDKSVFDSFPLDTIIYLTAESTEVLKTIEAGKVYVIGGLVDHNHQKGLCQKIAEEKKVATARLPLEENIEMKSRKVLTINHVFEILLAYCECKDWKSAILKILPQKKFTADIDHKTTEVLSGEDEAKTHSTDSCQSENKDVTNSS